MSDFNGFVKSKNNMNQVNLVLDAKRNGQIPIEIRLKLEDATNRKFSSPHGGPYEDSYDFDDGWDGFFLWENNSKEVRYT